MNKIKLNIFTPHELNHSSYVQTGLEEWAKQNAVSLTVRCRCLKNQGTIKIEGDDVVNTNKPQPKTSFYELKNLDTGKILNFACDLYDLDTEFSSRALEKCHYVFKRNYRFSLVEKLDKNYQKKLYPLGLTFGVRSEHHKGKYKYFIGLFCQNLKLAWKYDRYFFSRLYKEFVKQWRHWKFINTARLLERFNSYKPYRSDKILFQTRTFNESQQDVVEIHEQRYRLIKLLSQHFPDSFYGGFIPKGVAVEKYKDALSNVPSAPEEYLNFVKACDIVIYTRGLANSPAWKMAEYLSQGKVIMAEPLTTDLPVPLEHGIHLLYFNTDAELVENIKKVKADRQLAKRLSENARRYYEEQVHPAKNMERILTFMMQKEEWIP